MASERLDSDEDVDAILRLAVRKGSDHEELRDRLVRSAQELGISPDSLQEAEAEYLARKSAMRETLAGKEELMADWNAYRQSMRRVLVVHLSVYAAVIFFLVVINTLTSPQFPWAVFPALGWGIGIVAHLANSYRGGPPEYDEEFLRWRKRQWRVLSHHGADDD